MPAPTDVARLVEQFDRHSDSYRSGQYNETQLRREFLDPFFESLGWDVDNKQGYAEAYKDVIHEDAIKIGGATKAPDYCFRIGGARKYFVEAKKPAVNIKEDVSPAYQLRRYAWSAKLPLSILTDFEEFAVYDCRSKPTATDKAGIGRILLIDYRQYLDRWDEIANIFSRDAVLKGSFDKFAESTRAKKGTAEVDAAFLKDIESWRDQLARNLALRNPDLSQRELNFAVQRIIDRVIFLRIAEDRGIEDYGRLLSLTNGERVYPRLCTLFERADERYNSGLFHFHAEKDRHEPPDELTLRLDLDDKLLRDMLRGLYYPESPYEFSVLPADILGQVYEQFLGKVIRLTPSHQAKVEDKPEVKKAGGVYYTPTYIVEYIVQQTVGKLLGPPRAQASGGRQPLGASGAARTTLSPAAEPGASRPPLASGNEGQSAGVPPSGGRTSGGRKPAKAGTPAPETAPSLTPKQAAKLRILDPACGSGSFLIGAYQYLLDWHRDWYVNDGPEKHTKEIYQAAGGGWRLTTAERKRILLANIYGVDIDPQAVETTKLSLLLKVLEGESRESLDQQRRLFHARALPDLGDNIKCGNSLIGPDFYDDQQTSLFDKEERLHINVFDWSGKSGFPEIMKTGGFDAVIGNPPWGAEFTEPELGYLRRTQSRVVARMIDSYIYFISQALCSAKKDGTVGFIIPSTLLNQTDAKPVRELLLDRKLSVLVSLGQGIFGPKVLNTSTIFVSANKGDGDGFALQDLSQIPLTERRFAIEYSPNMKWSEWADLVLRDPHATFFVNQASGMELLDRMRRAHSSLEHILQGTIQRGVSPDVVAAHVISKPAAKSARLEIELLRPSVSGSQIKRYRSWKSDQHVIYTDRTTQLERYPNVAKYLKSCKDRNTCKEVTQGKHPWWSLHRPRDPEIFSSPKFIGLTTTKTIELIYDETSNLYVTDAMYVFKVKPSIDPWAYMAVLQSRAFLYFYRMANQGESRVIPQIKASKLLPLPFPKVDPKSSAWRKVSERSREMLSLHQQLASSKTGHERTAVERQIEATDRQIDRLVYDLYGLTDAEIAIVEEATGR